VDVAFLAYRWLVRTFGPIWLCTLFFEFIGHFDFDHPPGVCCLFILRKKCVGFGAALGNKPRWVLFLKLMRIYRIQRASVYELVFLFYTCTCVLC